MHQGPQPPTPFESLEEIDHLPAQWHVSVGMRGDNYTLDCYPTLQSVMKTAGANAESVPLDGSARLVFSRLLYLALTHPDHFIFTYFHNATQPRPRGRSRWVLCDLTILPHSSVCQVCGKTFIFVSSEQTQPN